MFRPSRLCPFAFLALGWALLHPEESQACRRRGCPPARRVYVRPPVVIVPASVCPSRMVMPPVAVPDASVGPRRPDPNPIAPPPPSP